MIELLESAKDVIACRVANEVTGKDLGLLMDRLDEAMAGEGKVHMFVETVSIQRIEMEGLPAHIQRAMPLLGKLNRFGRIAVVADQAWVRLGTRVESALLPFVSYQVFFPEQRDEALAWVEGRSAGQR